MNVTMHGCTAQSIEDVRAIPQDDRPEHLYVQIGAYPAQLDLYFDSTDDLREFAQRLLERADWVRTTLEREAATHV